MERDLRGMSLVRATGAITAFLVACGTGQEGSASDPRGVAGAENASAGQGGDDVSSTGGTKSAGVAGHHGVAEQGEGGSTEPPAPVA